MTAVAVNRAIILLVQVLLVLSPAAGAFAQEQTAGARALSPHDLEGYWVSLVTENWRYRMMTAPAGDHAGIDLTPAGEEVADAWDPAADEAAGESCKAYGAGGIMSIPTRLNIAWAADDVLRIDTDAGRQTRLLRFGAARDETGAGSWQGVSRARWELRRAGRGGPVESGTIAVETTGMRPGYVRRNGIPYSSEAVLMEYFEVITEDDGTQYLIVISELRDPVYLAEPVLTSTTFRKEPDGSGWNPSDCDSRGVRRDRP